MVGISMTSGTPCNAHMRCAVLQLLYSLLEVLQSPRLIGIVYKRRPNRQERQERQDGKVAIEVQAI